MTEPIRTNVIGSSSILLLDTHILVWVIANDRRLPEYVREQIAVAETLLVSAVIAWEFADLHHRGRLAGAAAFDVVIDALMLTIVDAPAELWKLAATLPNLHRDPIDRLLIAHAIHSDLPLVTADATMRKYPVRTIW